MTKVLILGSNGLLGQNLVKRFTDQFQVVAASLEPESYLANIPVKYFPLDLKSRSDTYKKIEKIKPDIIINAAAYTNVDGCEEDRENCWLVNVHAVENILDVADRINAIFVQVSTDYVFDGERGDYREIDAPNPRGNYARSKLAAENIIRESNVEYLIVRTQVLFGYGVNVRPNFALWVWDNLRQQKPIRVVTDQIGNPTYAPDLAEGIYRLLDQETYGLFHISGPDQISRYDFAVEIAHTFDLDASLITPITTEELNQKAPRPMNSTFKIDKLVNYTGWEPDPLNIALERFKKELETK